MDWAVLLAILFGGLMANAGMIVGTYWEDIKAFIKRKRV